MSAELHILSTRRHPSSVRPPSINWDFSETTVWIQVKFYGQLPLHHISRPFFFLFFKIFNLLQICSSAWQSSCCGAGVRCSSIVHKLRFLGNRCVDPGQILWVPPSPPYLQTTFLFYFSKFSNCYGFVALLNRAIVVAQASVVRPSSINSGFSETAAWIQAKFCGYLPLHHISRPLFSFVCHNFQFSNLYDFFFLFSLTWGRIGAKMWKCYSSSTSFDMIWAKHDDK